MEDGKFKMGGMAILGEGPMGSTSCIFSNTNKPAEAFPGKAYHQFISIKESIKGKIHAI
jgi:hypothetical protein